MYDRYDNIEYDFDFDNYCGDIAYTEQTVTNDDASDNKNRKQKKNSLGGIKDNRHLLLIVQFIICTLMACAAYILKLTDGELYHRLHQMYYANINLSLITTVEDTRPFSQRFDSEKDTETVSAVRYIDAQSDLVNDVYVMMNDMRKHPTSDTNSDKKASPTYRMVDGEPKLSEFVLAPVSSGVFTSYFGGRPDPTTGIWVNHYGVDIAANEGENIYASMAGDVVVAEESDSYGNYVVLNHGNGIKTLYAHCSKLYVNVGQYVEKGEVIAAVGSTGDSTGNHLHFELRINDVCYDPYDLVKQYYT